MAGRSMRHPSNRRVDFIGMDQDSSDEDSEEEEDIFFEEARDEIFDSSEDEDEDQMETEDVFMGSDGTAWTTRVPSTPLETWRFGLIDHNDGPINAAHVPGNNNISKADIFKLMVSDDTLEEIQKWTNEWGHYCVRRWNKKHKAKPRIWRDTSVTELRGFFGLILLAGVEKPRKKPWTEMWSKDERIRHPAFVATMARNRFFNLMGAVRFDDAVRRHIRTEARKRGEDCEEDHDKFEPIRKIFEQVTSSYQDLYRPAAKLCVDEQLVRFRGNCPFRVYIPQKPGKYGMKIWALVDNASGFVLKLIPYLGRTGSQPQVGLAKHVVLDLVSAYEGSCRGVVGDNFFTSMDLVQELLNRKLTYCGTLRKNRVEVPPYIKSVEHTKRENTFLFNEDHMVTLVRHNPKKHRYVLLLSSAHYDDETILVKHKKGEFELPVIIEYYNCNRGGVDTADQMVGNYTGQYPSKRWPMKIFIHLLDTSALNGYKIWMKNDPMWNNAHKSSRRKFIRELAYELIMPQIRLRAATAGNLHGYIRSAMKIMGVEHPHDQRPTSSRRTVVVAAQRARQGRCAFDRGSVRTRKNSRRTCKKCGRFICEEHWRLLCPACYTAFCERFDQQEGSPNSSASSD